MPKETLLESIYWDREQGVLTTRSEFEKEVSYEIKKDGNEEKLRELIDKIYNQRLRNKIDKYLDLTLEDMLKKESATLDKYYKQGFKDGINLLIECIS
jgi:hypothetical protein